MRGIVQELVVLTMSTHLHQVKRLSAPLNLYPGTVGRAPYKEGIFDGKRV